DRSISPLTGLRGSLGFEAAGEHGALDFLDGLSDVDVARAGARAVEDRAAPPDALGVVEDLEPLGGGVIARVEDEAVRVDDRGRADIALVAPERRAGRRAAGAEDALRRVVVPGAIVGRLESLGRWWRLVVDQV